jgi:hypothetical protein
MMNLIDEEKKKVLRLCVTKIEKKIVTVKQEKTLSCNEVVTKI